MLYTKSRNEFLSKGIYGGRYLVYAGATGDQVKARNAAKKVYDIAILSAGNDTNYAIGLDKYYIKRYAIELSPWEYNLDALKSLVDTCLQTGGWMVWMIHTSAAGWSSSIVQTLSDLIDYTFTQGLPIVSVDYVNRKYLKNM